MAKNEFICDCNIIHQDVVQNTIKQMADEDTFNKLAEFFKILGDTTRTKILYALDKNEMQVICSLIDLSPRKIIVHKNAKMHDLQQLIVELFDTRVQTV